MPDEVTEKIIGAEIEVHRHLGPGLLETIYEEALCNEFDLRSIDYARQVEVEVEYKGKVIKGQRLDLLIANEVVVELKSLSKVPDVAMAQLLSYLKSSGRSRGLILNFGEKRLIDGIQRVSL